jgi:hypothetical protein
MGGIGAGAQPRPGIWLCTGKAFDLAQPEAKWDSVKQRLSGIKLYIDKVNRADPTELEALAEVVNANEWEVAIECGGCLGFAQLDETNGEDSARIELAKIDKWYAAGGKVDYLELDGPIRRILHPTRGRQKLPSLGTVEECARQLMNYMRAVREAHPEIQFFLLTNFPNWGYRGGVSYHGRGENRQDWGDYDEVIRTVLDVAAEEGIGFAGVTVDNPYEYLIGEHFSVTLEDPAEVNWLRRVRTYEEFAREHGLEFNLIINSEAGGKESDEAFYRRTLKMLDVYIAAGGRPTRYVVQSWYKHPEAVVPEDERFSLTALVKAVMKKVEGE